jgi:indolepyruvate ferredoxin oxidoreductase beta subunit
MSTIRIQMILAGVGGQGILFSSRIFSELGLNLGLGVTGSETHGMSQRGGSVLSHLKLGAFHSPLIRHGAADILYSFDKNETYRTLKFVKEKGLCFVNLSDDDRLDPKIMSHLKRKQIRLETCDASGEAARLGSIRAANLVLIGYSVGTELVPFRDKDVTVVLRSVSRRRDIDRNLKAFKIGIKKAKP